MSRIYESGTVGAAIAEGSIELYRSFPDVSQPKFFLKGSAIPVRHAWTVESKDGKEKRLGSVLVIGTGDQQQHIKLWLSARDPTSEYCESTIAKGGVIRVTDRSSSFSTKPLSSVKDTPSSLLQVLLRGPEKEDENRRWQELLDSWIDHLAYFSQVGYSGSSVMVTRDLEIYEAGPGEKFGRDDGKPVKQIYSTVRVELSFGQDDKMSEARPITLKT